ncbi:unnamed protein product [Caenorhabditis angaria]|uniref:Uncharacterized protein n=1 Tax=Caenorhabditis angaria TaxID=860376 RepID=A0A9P1I791_9PELO|nr:unnamed protein product [Caenorhabditis angaria]
MSAEPKKRRLDDENVSLEENNAETTGWFDISYEMRKILIDEMDVETRSESLNIAIRQRISAEKNVGFLRDLYKKQLH